MWTKICKNLSIKKIYSFEASPQNYQILEKNFSSFQTDKVEIYNYGIGDKISKDFINQTIESSSSTINKLNKDVGSLALKSFIHP